MQSRSMHIRSLSFQVLVLKRNSMYQRTFKLEIFYWEFYLNQFCKKKLEYMNKFEGIYSLDASKRAELTSKLSVNQILQQTLHQRSLQQQMLAAAKKVAFPLPKVEKKIYIFSTDQLEVLVMKIL